MPEALHTRPSRSPWASLWRSFWPWTLGVLALIAAALMWLGHQRRAAPPILFLCTTPSALATPEGAAIQDLVQWQLETCGFAVLSQRMERPGIPPALAAATLVLELDPRRDGDRLALHWRHSKAGRLRQSGDQAWATGQAEGGPRAVILQMLEGLPCPLDPKGTETLVPSAPLNFWRLVKAVSVSWDFKRLQEGAELAATVSAEEPDNATARFLRGDLLYRSLLVDFQSGTGTRTEAEDCFLRALELAPEHPQATFLMVQLKTDAGDQRSALDLARSALRPRPQALSLLSGLAYAARTSGLLPLARLALERRAQLGPPEFMSQGAENTWLYLGDMARFDRELVYEADRPRGSVAAFYKGYLALARGDRAAAGPWFQRCREGAVFGQFDRLSEVFQLICLDRREEALVQLRALSADRVSLRVPDGEFTFKLAEAYALLGQRGEALDMASKAFSQGFGCTPWYERSPFLGVLRDSPRWSALLQHLRERQRLLEERYPLSSFSF